MKNDDDEPREEYDFSDAVQGKHFRAYRAAHGLVSLDEDLRAEFPDDEAVNEALRALLRIKSELARVP